MHNFPHPVKRIGQVRSQEKKESEKPINNQFDMLVQERLQHSKDRAIIAPKKNLIGQLNNIKLKSGIGKGIRNLNCRSHENPKEN